MSSTASGQSVVRVHFRGFFGGVRDTGHCVHIDQKGHAVVDQEHVTAFTVRRFATTSEHAFAVSFALEDGREAAVGSDGAVTAVYPPTTSGCFLAQTNDDEPGLFTLGTLNKQTITVGQHGCLTTTQDTRTAARFCLTPFHAATEAMLVEGKLLFEKACFLEHAGQFVAITKGGHRLRLCPKAQASTFILYKFASTPPAFSLVSADGRVVAVSDSEVTSGVWRPGPLQTLRQPVREWEKFDLFATDQPDSFLVQYRSPLHGYVSVDQHGQLCTCADRTDSVALTVRFSADAHVLLANTKAILLGELPLASLDSMQLPP